MVFGTGDFSKWLGLVEVMRMGPSDGISAVMNKEEMQRVSLPCQDPWRQWSFVNQGETLPWSQTCQQHDLKLPIHLGEISVIYITYFA